MIAKYNNLKVEIIGESSYEYLIQLDEKVLRSFTIEDVLQCHQTVFEYERFNNLKKHLFINKFYKWADKREIVSSSLIMETE